MHRERYSNEPSKRNFPATKRRGAFRFLKDSTRAMVITLESKTSQTQVEAQHQCNMCPLRRLFLENERGNTPTCNGFFNANTQNWSDKAILNVPISIVRQHPDLVVDYARCSMSEADVNSLD